MNELRRRGKSGKAFVNSTDEEKPGFKEALQTVLANCKLAGYTGTITQEYPIKSEVQSMINFMQGLYNQVVVR